MSEKNYSILAIKAICDGLLKDGFAVISEQELLASIGIEAAQHRVQADVCPGCGAPNATVINSIHEYVCEECGTRR
jgi:hypothetical protein